MNIDSDGVNLIEAFLNDTLDHLIQVLKTQNIADDTSKWLNDAVHLLIPGDLGKHAISEGGKAFAKAYANGDGDVSLFFNSQDISNYLSQKISIPNDDELSTPSYITAILEYLSGELLELSGNAARDSKVKIISPPHVMLAIRNDMELNALLSIISIASPGVVTNIHKVLHGN